MDPKAMALVALIRAIASASIETWREISQLLQISETDAEQIQRALQADQASLDTLIAHLRERVPE